MSAIGSDHTSIRPYQLALVTPGISPESASFRKQRRQRPNFRIIGARHGHNSNSGYSAVAENFGRARAFAISDFFAKTISPERRYPADQDSLRANGIPNVPKQFSRFVVPGGRRADRDIHPRVFSIFA